MQTATRRRLGSAITLTATAALAVGCSSSTAAEETGDVRAMCALFEEVEGPQDITLDYLDELLEVALDDVRPAVQEIRDAVAADGEAAFDDPDIAARFDEIGSYAGGTCQEDG